MAVVVLGSNLCQTLPAPQELVADVPEPELLGIHLEAPFLNVTILQSINGMFKPLFPFVIPSSLTSQKKVHAKKSRFNRNLLFLFFFFFRVTQKSSEIQIFHGFTMSPPRHPFPFLVPFEDVRRRRDVPGGVPRCGDQGAIRHDAHPAISGWLKGEGNWRNNIDTQNDDIHSQFISTIWEKLSKKPGEHCLFIYFFICVIHLFVFNKKIDCLCTSNFRYQNWIITMI